MNEEKLFASFMLDGQNELEIALQADLVVEATRSARPFQPLPTSIDYLEGLVSFRNQMIPVVNLKKRLRLPDTGYEDDAKIAVVQVAQKRFGLLFEDIRDVLRVETRAIELLDKTLMSEDTVINGLITLDNGKRTLELLDIDRLFPQAEGVEEAIGETDGVRQPIQQHYSRIVVFSSHGQTYGISVEDAREICFLSDIDDLFQNGTIDGALKLRGNTMPVLDSARLLGPGDSACQRGDDARILVMESGELFFGFMVDRIHEIIVFPEDEILSVPDNKIAYIKGICPCGDGSNVVLLNVLELIDSQLEEIKALARRQENSTVEQLYVSSITHHVISENCYLIFSIGKHFAIELKDVQEIIETDEVMHTNEESGLVDGLINLRGKIVPVLDLRRFYDGFDGLGTKKSDGAEKLIIGQAHGNLLALMVDEIVTIYKQEKFHQTPSLRPELQDKKDTLDRLIEFLNDHNFKEQVLVVNVAQILANHLQIRGHEVLPFTNRENIKEAVAVN